MSLNYYSRWDLHVAHLRDAYESVGSRTWVSTDFLEPNLKISRDLFTPDSLIARHPKPRLMEVYALLSGLPFQRGFTDNLVAVQQQIAAVLGKSLHYWVAPENLGLEYCVFKWPSEVWNEAWRAPIDEALSMIHQSAFQYDIGGVQVNPDGCVVALGFDQEATIFRIREQLRMSIPFLPAKQSSWAHVPLGRILEPLGEEKFTQLRHLMREMSDRLLASIQIDTFKFIHEQRWYMEERTTLAEYPLIVGLTGRGK